MWIVKKADKASDFQKSIPSHGRLRVGLRVCKKWFRAQVDRFYFPIWLLFQCAKHRKKAVILYRLAALGDVLCTLPVFEEIRRRHPGRLRVCVTSASYKKMALLSRSVDCVFGVSWLYGTPWKYSGDFFGLVEKVYVPQATDERSPGVGGQSHLVDDLAASCGLTLPKPERQPHLFPSAGLIKTVQARYGLAEPVFRGQWLIGINCGRTWPVRMWEAARWQQLVDLLHANYDATILQFGLTGGAGKADEYDQINGVISVTNRLQSDELVALVASCRLLISIDSGPVHVAGAVGTPVIGLFGAVNPEYRLPLASPAVGLFADVPCLFCHHTNPIKHWQSGCPNNIRCMKELDVQMVFEAVKSILS